MNRTLTFLAVLLLALFTAFPTATEACSCFPSTFEEQYNSSKYVDSVYILGQVELSKKGELKGLVDPTDPVDDINADIYFLAYQSKSHKGCNACKGDFVYYITGGNSALCGVNLQPGWYLLGSSSKSGTNKRYKSLNSCGLIRTKKSLTPQEKKFIKDNSKYCKKCKSKPIKKLFQP